LARISGCRRSAGTPGTPASFDAQGTLVTAFRAAEDRTFADIDDKAWPLDPTATVGLVHPHHLGDDRAAWSELFADYDIIQPFPQLGRELFNRTDLDPESWTGAQVAGRKLFALSASGWEFDTGHAALLRYWPGDYTVELSFGPGYHWQEPDLPQHLTDVRLLHTGGGPASFDNLTPIALSEVVRDVRFLLS
jgi:hypothetical protein